jgi:uncharacterized phage protein (TIGR01671 family)
MKKRVIKFRAWNKELKQFDYNPVFSGNDNNSGLKTVYINKIFNCNEKPYKNDNVVFEQYTGVKDDKEKEIYEGDILECIDADYETGSEKKLTGAAKFKYGRFFAKTNIAGFVGLGRFVEKKIIGNIHENKELLRK